MPIASADSQFFGNLPVSAPCDLTIFLKANSLFKKRNCRLVLRKELGILTCKR